MPELIPSSLLIQIINFLVLLFILNIILYRPIRGILNKRKEEMDSTSGITDEWKRKIEKYSNEIEENIDSTRKQGLKERLGLRDNGLAAEKELLQNAYSQVEESLGKAKNEIKEKINNARVSLQREMESFSNELAEKILGRSL
jgi:F-type H+-transporting ATPase subunit b